MVAALAGCTAILGFDKDVFEQGREPGEGGSSGDGGSPADGEASPVESRGIVDPSFGDGGSAVIPTELPWSANHIGAQDDCTAAVDASERILVACATNRASPPGQIALLTRAFRVSSGGGLDTDFGSADGGGVRTSEYVPHIVTRPNGGVLLVGYETTPTLGYSEMGKNIVVSLAAAGQPDPTFADAGRLSAPLTTDTENDAFVAATTVGDTALLTARVAMRDGVYGALQLGSAWVELDPSTGRFTRLVSARPPAFQNDFATSAARVGPRTVLFGAAVTTGYSYSSISLTAYDGDTLDTSFGDAGRSLKRILDSDYTVRTVGVVGTSPERYLASASVAADGGALVQFLANGQPDPPFGDGGVKPFPVAPVDPPGRLDVRSTLLAPDGKILVAGSLVFGNESRRAFIVRMNAAGDVDPTFGKDGWIIPTFGRDTGDSTFWQISFTKNGSLLAVATVVGVSGTRDMHVFRFR